MAMSGWQPRTSRLKSRRSAMVEGLQVAQIYKPPFESAGCVRFLVPVVDASTQWQSKRLVSNGSLIIMFNKM